MRMNLKFFPVNLMSFLLKVNNGEEDVVFSPIFYWKDCMDWQI